MRSQIMKLIQMTNNCLKTFSKRFKKYFETCNKMRSNAAQKKFPKNIK